MYHCHWTSVLSICSLFAVMYVRVASHQSPCQKFVVMRPSLCKLWMTRRVCGRTCAAMKGQMNDMIDTLEDTSPLCHALQRILPRFCEYSSVKRSCQRTCFLSNDEDQLECGIRDEFEQVISEHLGRITRNISGRDKRIVGGRPVRQGAWPWLVSLRHNGTQICSGTILSKELVFTAAHCIDSRASGLLGNNFSITAGEHDIFTNEDYEETIQVKKIFAHPDFNISIHEHEKGWLGILSRDIAILQLEKPIKLSRINKALLCLPDMRRPFPEETECTIVGWGHTQHQGNQSNILREAHVLTVPLRICNLPMAYNYSVTDWNICAGFEEGGVDACQYDSGGPLMCNRRGRWFAQGLVSSGFECARPHGYGLYARLPKLVTWVVETILEKVEI